MGHVQIFPDVLLVAQLLPVSAEAEGNPGTEGEVDPLSVPHDQKLPRRGRASTPEPGHPRTSDRPVSRKKTMKA